MTTRKVLFTITKDDCDWQYIRGSGKGGQKRNKTSNAVRCTHRLSGATGFAQDTRSQSKNRELAFERMATTKEFKDWHRLEVSKRLGEEQRIEENVDREMKRIRIEVRKDGVWTEVDETYFLTTEEQKVMAQALLDSVDIID